MKGLLQCIKSFLCRFWCILRLHSSVIIQSRPHITRSSKTLLGEGPDHQGSVLPRLINNMEVSRTLELEEPSQWTWRFQDAS